MAMEYIEIPVFTGSDLRSWLDWMENRFHLYEYNDEERLQFAYGFIYGEAEAYYHWRQKLKIFDSWNELRDSFLMRFGADDDPERMILQAESDRCYNALINGDMEKRGALQSHSHVVPEVESTVKVPYLNLGQNEIDSLLGYRERNEELVVMHLPMFDGANPESWIVQADRFFVHYEDDAKFDLIFLYLKGAAYQWFRWVMNRTKFKDWSDFKCKLLAQFGSVPSCSLVETNSGAGSVASNVVVHEPYLARNTTSPTIEVVFMSSGDCLADKKAEEKLDNDSLEEREQKTVAESEISDTDDTEKATKDCCLADDQETEHSLVEVELKDDSTSDIESIHETKAEKVQELPSLTTEVIKEKSVNNIEEVSQNWSEISTPALMDERFIMPQTKMLREDNLFFVEGSSDVESYRAHQQVTYEDRRVTSKHKQRKLCKAWQFKYKTGVMQFKYINSDMRSLKLMAVVTRSFPGNRRHDSKGMQRFLLGAMKSYIWHKWRSKSEKLLNISEQFPVIKHPSFVHYNNPASCPLWLPVQISPVPRVTPLHAEMNLISKEYTTQRLLACKEICRITRPCRDIVHESTVIAHQVWHRWRIKKSVTLRVWSLELLRDNDLNVIGVVLLDLSSVHVADDLRSWCRLHMRRYMRKDHSSIWHRWRYKTLGSAAVFHNGAVSERSDLALVLSEFMWQWLYFVLQQHVSSHGCDSTIILRPSLWSSLISRRGVYKRMLAGLLSIDVMIWWFTLTSKSDLFKKMVREQREKTESCIHEMVRVENQQSLKEESFIQIHVKRHQGQVLIHQQKQWKKFYKSWMFNYKERLKQVLALPLHVVLKHWSSSCFVWHRWRSKERGRREREISWIFQCFHFSGGCMSVYECIRMVVSSPTSLRASLFSKGKVLIDIKLGAEQSRINDAELAIEWHKSKRNEASTRFRRFAVGKINGERRYKYSSSSSLVLHALMLL